MQFALKKIIIIFVLVTALIAVIVSVSVAAPELAGNYDVFRLSVGNNGLEGDGSSFHAYSSYDGRYVAFESYARNWAYDGSGSTNYADIFVRDTEAETTTKLTYGITGGTGNDKSFFPSVSADGRYIAYLSYASNLVPGDTNGSNPWEVEGLDVFLYDQQYGSTSRVSLNEFGEQIDGESVGVITPSGKYIVFFSNASNVMSPPTIDGVTYLYIRDWQANTITRITQTIDNLPPSGILHQVATDYDANYIAFSSDYSNLVPNDTNGLQDVFLYNRQTGSTILVSRNPAGFSANGLSGRPQLSSNGQYLAFSSVASDLVPGDTGGFEDVFLYEIATGNLQRISVTSGGADSNGDNKEPTICENGRYIAWTSGANNYTPLDINVYNDVYFYDTFEGVVRLVSKDMNGYSPNGAAHRAWVSTDCRYIIFASDSDNMIIGDTNGKRDLYMGRLVWPFDLSTSGQHVPAFANPGDTLDYHVWVRNHGLETGLGTLVAPIPEHTTFISGSATNGAIYNSALNRVEWIGSISGESEQEITFSVLVEPGLTDTVFLELNSHVFGDYVTGGYFLDNVTIINGYYSLLPSSFGQ